MLKRSRTSLILALIIVIVFAGLYALFINGLHHNPRQLPSEVQGRTVAGSESNTTDSVISFQLPRLDNGQIMTASDMPKPPYLLNVWGSWCPECHVEHPYLLTLGQQIPIIGINWPAGNQDEAQKARAFLAKSGNPYRAVLIDNSGQTIIDLGVYGAPETFLVGKDNIILHRHAGPIDAQIWQQEFQPLIAKEQ